MSKKNNAVTGTGRVRARDLYDLTRVLDVMLEAIEKEDNNLRQQPVSARGKTSGVCGRSGSCCIIYLLDLLLYIVAEQRYITENNNALSQILLQKTS